MKYILEGKTVVECSDLLTWARWFEDADRGVAKDIINDVKVSTVFLGLNHSFTEDGPPILFETMIFGGKFDDELWRYATWEEAEAGHAKAVEKVRNENRL